MNLHYTSGFATKLQDTTTTKQNKTKPNVVGTPVTDPRSQEEGSQGLEQ